MERDQGWENRTISGFVSTLATYTQQKLPYSIDKVQSNDELFGGNKKYVAKCDEYMSTVIDSIMSQLGSLAKLAEGNTKLRSECGACA